METIVARSTPMEAAARGVVRLSGPRSLNLVRMFFHARDSQDSPFPWCRGVHEGWLLLGPEQGEVPCRLWVFRGPASFTGEDLVEIHLPGAPFLVKWTEQILIQKGASPAGPGEFTRRAFLNGRLDLTRAEAVAALIEAENEEQLRLAQAALGGAVKRRVERFKERILDCLVPLELSLDFSDQDLDLVLPGDLRERLASLSRDLLAEARSKAGSPPGDLPRVVLSGPPNAGKSSLFNRLLGRAEALVSPEPGTTRDVLEGEISLFGRRVLLVDTAGAEPGRGAVGKAAQSLRRSQLLEADLVLEVRDVRQFERQREPPGREALQVLTRQDLMPWVRVGEENSLVSNLTGQGLAELRQALAFRLFPGSSRMAGARVQARHLSAFAKSARRVRGAWRAAGAGLGTEVMAAELHGALLALLRITGEEQDDLVLDAIFAGFCVGK